ncbi:hypothetical protein W02_31320 [Nitrospira sp. KM1]|uniref:response regulator n=1 Tax=Nitrospira sp. KM1 TaxID=1936990 RepID=UPI0013A75E6C|nr:response regulator transcription factor [Nitrospira sp. KM1]BCA55992.1 hypothetical protein W02_31320 [Nitrospira sp. KM1]
MIRVVVIDDFAAMRNALIEVVRAHPALELVGAGMNGEDAVHLADVRHPDVILMDVSTDTCDGIEATRHVKRRHPEIAVIGMAAQPSEEAIFAMRSVGASDILAKGIPTKQLYSRILGMYEIRQAVS